MFDTFQILKICTENSALRDDFYDIMP